MSTQVLREMYERVVKNFMDVLVMAELRNNPLSGYDVISLIHKKFNLLVSSGTVYSLLYSLERDGLIEGKFNDRKRVYVLTEKGEKTIGAILSANDQIQNMLVNLFRLNSNLQNRVR